MTQNPLLMRDFNCADQTWHNS